MIGVIHILLISLIVIGLIYLLVRHFKIKANSSSIESLFKKLSKSEKDLQDLDSQIDAKWNDITSKMKNLIVKSDVDNEFRNLTNLQEKFFKCFDNIKELHKKINEHYTVLKSSSNGISNSEFQIVVALNTSKNLQLHLEYYDKYNKHINKISTLHNDFIKYDKVYKLQSKLRVLSQSFDKEQQSTLKELHKQFMHLENDIKNQDVYLNNVIRHKNLLNLLSEESKQRLSTAFSKLNSVSSVAISNFKLNLSKVRLIPTATMMLDRNKEQIDKLNKRLSTSVGKVDEFKDANNALNNLDKYKTEIEQLNDVINTYKNINEVCINNVCVSSDKLSKFIDDKC